MTQNKIELFKKVMQWKEQEPKIGSRRVTMEYSDDYGWTGWEEKFYFFCFMTGKEGSIMDGFCVYNLDDKLYNEEEFLELKKERAGD